VTTIVRRVVRFACCLALFVAACFSTSAARGDEGTSPPRLVVVVSVDQFAYAYLDRFHDNYSPDGIFRRFEETGAVFTNCHHRHAFTLTGPGHSVFLTGAYPNTNGIVGNDWYDRTRGKGVYCVADADYPTIGGKKEDGISPRSLLVDTLGDVLKLDTAGKAKVIGLAIKDRAGVLMAGHSADAAYWFDSATGNWVTSRYYRDDLPGYLRVFNESDIAEQYADSEWRLLLDASRYQHHRDDDSPLEKPPAGMTRAFPHRLSSANDPHYYNQVTTSPAGNSLTLLAAREIIVGEELGSDDVPDILAINLSSNDYVGHAFGPYSLEVEDMCYRTDVQLGELARYLDKQVGEGQWTMALSADHGVAPNPEFARERKLPAARNPLGSVGKMKEQLEKVLREALGVAESEPALVETVRDHEVFLHRDHKSLQGDRYIEAQRIVRDWLLEQSSVVAAATREQLLSGSGGGGLDEAMRLAYHPRRSGDVLFVMSPYDINGSSAATHGAPWNYDSHVPLLLMGSGISPGRFDRPVSPAALAATLARILVIEPPAANVEEPLAEALFP